MSETVIAAVRASLGQLPSQRRRGDEAEATAQAVAQAEDAQILWVGTAQGSKQAALSKERIDTPPVELVKLSETGLHPEDRP